MTNPILNELTSLGIHFQAIEHEPAFTVSQAEEHWTQLQGTACKNLFLRNKKGDKHYLIVLQANTSFDIKRWQNQFENERMSFGSEQRLSTYLKVEAGSLSPLSIINDDTNTVELHFEKSLLEAHHLIIHPNVNTISISIATTDLLQYIQGKAKRYKPLVY